MLNHRQHVLFFYPAARCFKTYAGPRRYYIALGGVRLSSPATPLAAYSSSVAQAWKAAASIMALPKTVIVRLPCGTDAIGYRDCAVIPTEDAGRKDAPVAEVQAPQGYTFSGGETALCVHTYADIDEIVHREALIADEPPGPVCIRTTVWDGPRRHHGLYGPFDSVDAVFEFLNLQPVVGTT